MLNLDKPVHKRAVLKLEIRHKCIVLVHSCRTFHRRFRSELHKHARPCVPKITRTENVTPQSKLSNPTLHLVKLREDPLVEIGSILGRPRRRFAISESSGVAEEILMMEVATLELVSYSVIVHLRSLLPILSSKISGPWSPLHGLELLATTQLSVPKAAPS